MLSCQRSKCHVFGIIGKLFKNVRECCLFRDDILKTLWVIQVLNSKIQIFLLDFWCSLPFSQWLLIQYTCIPNYTPIIFPVVKIYQYGSLVIPNQSICYQSINQSFLLPSGFYHDQGSHKSVCLAKGNIINGYKRRTAPFYPEHTYFKETVTRYLHQISTHVHHAPPSN